MAALWNGLVEGENTGGSTTSSSAAPNGKESQGQAGEAPSSQKPAQSPMKDKLSPQMFAIMERQVADMRASLLSYKVLGNNPEILSTAAAKKELPGHADILVFGPSGSGKSSLIRTFYMALNNTLQIPAAMAEKIIVKDTNLNEGTLRYVSAVIKPRDLAGQTSSILCHDTRGQIWMDQKEFKQLDIIMQGRVQDEALVAQRNHRYARLLWEFWKQDVDLFPSEILMSRSGLGTKPHALIFAFDGSMEEIPNGDDETAFYRDIIGMAREKGYFYPQVVLTRIDKVEKHIPPQTEAAEAELRLRQLLDQKIEAVVLRLGISRASVHFVENYHNIDPGHFVENNVSIDFHALRILQECCQNADAFLKHQLERRRTYCTVQ